MIFVLAILPIVAGLNAPQATLESFGIARSPIINVKLFSERPLWFGL